MRPLHLNFYPNTAITDETQSNISAPVYLTSSYYITKKALLNYTEAITLFGIRRTGKTTVLKQLWNEYKTDNSVFLTIDEEVTIQHIMNYLNEQYNSIDLLFIDEITRINDLDYNFHKLLDHYKLVGTKIICAGTDSYLLSLSQKDTALGRLNLIRFLPLLFEDLKAIDGSLNFKTFCLNGKMFTNDDQVTIIANNIFHSIDRSVSSKNTLQGEQVEDIKNAIMLLIELLLGTIRNKLPALKIKIVYSKYIIEEQKFFDINNLNRDMVNAVFNILFSIKSSYRRIPISNTNISWNAF